MEDGVAHRLLHGPGQLLPLGGVGPQQGGDSGQPGADHGVKLIDIFRPLPQDAAEGEVGLLIDQPQPGEDLPDRPPLPQEKEPRQGGVEISRGRPRSQGPGLHQKALVGQGIPGVVGLAHDHLQPELPDGLRGEVLG